MLKLETQCSCLKAANKDVSVLGMDRMVKRNFQRLDNVYSQLRYYLQGIHSTTFRVLCTGMVSHLGEGQISVGESSAKGHQIGVWIEEQEL